MRLSHLSVALALAITTSGAAQAQQFSKIVSFGDSLTDAGNTAAADGNAATAIGNSWTTNPDSTHSQYLSLLLGAGAQNNSLAGGSNYAFAGACAMNNGTVTLAGAFNCYLPFPSVQSQVTGYIAANGGQLDPNKIYTLWAGANDILTGSGISAGAAQAYAGQSAQVTVGLAGALLQNGAQTVVLFNLPDLGVTPANLGTANQAGASALTTIYNLNFTGALTALSANYDGVVAIDTYAIINEVRANPGAFGFTNVNGMACTTGPGVGGAPTAGACGPAGSGAAWTYAAGTNTSYLFADPIHPTGGAHQLLANVVFATISAPGVVSLAPEVALQSVFAHNTAISDALDSEWAAGSEVGKVRGFTSVQFGQQNIESSIYTPALDGDSTNLNVGATYRMSENATFGVAATIGNGSANAGGLGSFDGSSILFGVFGQYEVNGLYGRIGLSGGSTDMDITRNIDLQATVRKETGSTAISQQSGTLEVGYVFKGDSFTHGPFAGLETTQSDVEGYVEGSTSTSMRFDSFSRDSNLTSVGYQFSGTFDSFKPFARVAWVNESNTDQVIVRGGTANLPANFSLPGFAPSDDSYIDWNVGASMSFGVGFDGYISYRARTGNDVQDNDSISIGIRKTF
ncbi:MAG: hypothetical protein RIS67_1024 [Pseudomonadota bacterium]